MKKRFRLGLAAASLCAMAVAPAQAQLVATGLDCNAGNVMETGFGPDALACSGAWAGNITPQLAAVESQLALDFAPFMGFATEFLLVGKSDDPNSGPFTMNAENSTSGTLSFDTPINGIFAVALKAGNSFSVYLFDGGISGLGSIDFSTAGVSVNQNGQAQGLSHAALFSLGPIPSPIPEPQSYALMLAGLGVLGFLVRRRRNWL
jgi:hypothetical protein